MQEELGQQVATLVEQWLECRGVGVVMVAEHSCMTRRGVRALGAETITFALRGELRTDAGARGEFLQLADVAGSRAA